MRKVKKKNIFNTLKRNLNRQKEIRKLEKEELEEKRVSKNPKKKGNLNKKNIEIKKEKNIKNKNSKNYKETTSKKKVQTNNSKKKTKTIKKKKNKRSFWKRLVTFILILGIIGVLALTSFFAYIVITSPEFSESAFNVKDQTVVYDINGEIIATLGVEKRESVTYDQLPQVLIDAIIATEDSRFFQHNGVDLPRFIKATVYQLLGRDEAGGASTLTMQTVKNNLTKKDAIEKNMFDKIIRKFQDVYLAVFKVEKEYSKEEIIELYVNNYNLGSNIYGVGEASKYYFGKSVSELTLPEASMIAGLFQAPGRHNPYRSIESAEKRRNTVLYLMERHGYITKEEETMAKNITVESLLVGAANNTKYQGFIDTVADEVEELTGDNPYTVPMKIYTTMEKSIQDGINSIMSNDEWYWKNDPNVQAGIAIVNVETGAVAAVGAGRNRSGIRTFNYATGAYKQPGSTAKPIFDYGPGIEYNNFSSYTLFNDEPWGYTNGPQINNWDVRFQGLMTTRYALQYSRNIPALKAFQQVGPKNSQKFAYSLGLDVSLNSSSENYRIVNDSTGVDNTINEAYSIGGAAEGFTPLMMASAYAGFASGGYYTAPYTVTKIEYRETGEVIENKPTKERVMKDSTAYIMNNILESAVHNGFDGGTAKYKGHVAAKTGTSNHPDYIMEKYNLPGNAVNDLWTVAYTSQYSIAVWYGYDTVTETTYNVSYGNHKEGVVAAVMNYIPIDNKGWSMPSSVVASQVEKETWPAKLPSKYTPSDMIMTEFFVRGTQPTEVSERYTKLNDITNTKTDTKGNSITITWNYTEPKVLTESYIKNYFNNNVYGNQKDHYVNERINYNKNTLGDIGFGIYQKDTNGSLKLIDYVPDNTSTNNNTHTYTYTGYGNTTLVIKAEHQKFKSNASEGVEIKVNLGEAPSGKISATLTGNSIINVKIGEYKEEGFKSIQYTTSNDGNINVLNIAKIKYQVNVSSTLKEFNTAKEFENYINTLPAGTYKITYIISHLDAETTKSRSITLR